MPQVNVANIDRLMAAERAEREYIAAHPNESVGEKLYREAELLLEGTARGVKKAAVDAIEHPGETAVKFGTAAVLGGGMAILYGRAGILGLTARVGGLALGYNFYKDVYRRAGVTSEAVADTWRSPVSLDYNKDVVGQTLGPFIVDTGIMTAGGATGIYVARQPIVFDNANKLLDTIGRMPWRGQVSALHEDMMLKHEDTAHHQNRVGEMAKLLAEQLGEARGVVEAAEVTGRVHDTGKLQTPDHILKGEGSLKDAEFAVMKEHAAASGRILRERVQFPERLKDVPELAQGHHERLDGKGYPDGLSGRRIETETRVTTVADVVDALTHKRGYKGKTNLGEILTELTEAAAPGARGGWKFDGRVVEAFLDLPAERALPVILADGGTPVPGLGREFKGYTMREILESYRPGAPRAGATLPPRLIERFTELYGPSEPLKSKSPAPAR